MRRSIYLLLALLLMNLLPTTLTAQEGEVAEALKRLQMENIRVAAKGDTIVAAFETSVYRGNYHALGLAIGALLQLPDSHTFQLVLLNNDLPQLCVTLPASLADEYKAGERSLVEVYRMMRISSSDMGAAMHALRGTKRECSAFGKIDLVVYPGVTLINNVTYKLYRAGFDLQPAIETQLWKGASLRLQVCFPIVNNEGGSWDEIRPGYLTLRQHFIIDQHWKGFITGGNFSSSRIGVAGGIGYYSTDRRWKVEAEGGLTGMSHLYGKDPGMSPWKRLDGRIRAGYYIPRLNTQIDVDGGRFVYGDYGVRGTLTRYFGEYIVGVYAMHTGGNKNYGFHFSIPLPGKKRSRHPVRLMLPGQFSYQYSMQSGPDYVRRALGVNYSTEPKTATNARFWQPDYIRHYLMESARRMEQKEKKKEKGSPTLL
ncbi:MAG: YjbH domain-containing protein [Mediterranea sp.]|nr:YjbH domain-containing protein [Mediterranea sp.]